MITPPSSTPLCAERSPRPRVLLAFDGGGFLAEAKSVMWALQEDFELQLASPLPPKGFDSKAIPPVPLHAFTRTTRIGERHWWQRVVRLVQGLIDARLLIAAVRPDAVVCLGSSIAVPLFAMARAAGVPTVFIESLTRVSRASTTGKLVDRFRLCDRLYVQWPEATKLYRHAIYKGTVS